MAARETARMMKLQDVVLKAIAKKLTRIEAADIAGMSVRNMCAKSKNCPRNTTDNTSYQIEVCRFAIRLTMLDAFGLYLVSRRADSPTARHFFFGAIISVTRPTLVSPVYRLPCLSQAM